MIHVAALTLKELTRRRFVAAAIVATLALVALTGWGFARITHIHPHNGPPLSHVQILGVSATLLILVAYMFSFVLGVLAVFIGAPAIANDIESGVLLPIVTRPLSRAALVAGRLLALGVAVCGYTLVAGAAEFAVVRATTGYLPPHPLAALGYLCLLALVMLSFAFALGTRLPAIAASIVAVMFFGIAWMGGIAGSLGDYYENDTIRNAGTISQLLLPTDAMWRAAVFQLEPAITLASAASRGWAGPFFVVSPPPLAMLLWAVGWIALAMVLAMRSFALRDL